MITQRTWQANERYTGAYLYSQQATYIYCHFLKTNKMSTVNLTSAVVGYLFEIFRSNL